MNREERRKMEKIQRKAINRSKLTPQQKQIYLDLMSESYKTDYIEVGTKVTVNYDRIMERTKGEMNPKFQLWLTENKGNTFTVEYEEIYEEKKLLCCLVEDTTTPKWLFYKGDLTIVESE